MTTEKYPCPKGRNGRHKFGSTLSTGNQCQLCQYISGGPPPKGLADYLVKQAEDAQNEETGQA